MMIQPRRRYLVWYCVGCAGLWLASAAGLYWLLQMRRAALTPLLAPADLTRYIAVAERFDHAHAWLATLDMSLTVACFANVPIRYALAHDGFAAALRRLRWAAVVQLFTFAAVFWRARQEAAFAQGLWAATAAVMLAIAVAYLLNWRYAARRRNYYQDPAHYLNAR